MTDALALAAAALALAAGLCITITVPWGGKVPIGLTLAMALPALLPWNRVAVVAVAGVGLAMVARRHRPHVGWRAARWATALTAGALVSVAIDATTTDEHVLATAVAAAIAVIVVDAAWMFVRRSDAPVRLRSAVPVYLTLACGGVLFAVAVDEVGVAMASVAAFPLLLTRIAFQRYAEASTTLQQTVQALGLVPELAGLAPLGHSERSAWYAGAIAASVGFDEPSTDRIVMATRLHHLGAVRHDEGVAPTTPAEVAATGARILRESGFLGEVANLLQVARADGYGTDSPSLAAAVIRVATAFDHVVLDDPSAVDRGLALLSAVSLDRFGRQAAGALLTLVATDPDLVGDAIAAGARFRNAGEGLELEPLVADEAGAALLPFTHRQP